MKLEDNGNIEAAIAMFHKAWNEATDDYEESIVDGRIFDEYLVRRLTLLL